MSQVRRGQRVVLTERRGALLVRAGPPRYLTQSGRPTKGERYRSTNCERDREERERAKSRTRDGKWVCRVGRVLK